MNNIQKDVLLGALLGLIVCFLGTVIYIVIVLPIHSISETFAVLVRENLLTKVITLGALPNGLLFQFFIKKNQLYKARGVLMSVILIAVFFIIYNLI
ncbi:hypothetical protein [Wenyingzhuangia aestuarii]|uniref:hypothetical protein n=1 Tax=Wenyingzhuangia aestuarii TaxID=1647582 RepID=UPI00143870DF|nr:hypothetical protein [Wenyingzhuangia aestuarii]NJB83801.1 uncharacterized membrane protein YozB (DUF420 family) [Wenyingzhuangia aestuarii]